MGKTIILMLLTCCGWTTLYGQSIVRGILLDETRQPIAMATVEAIAFPDSIIRETVTTNEHGSFEIRLSPARYTLRISFLGYKTYIVPETYGVVMQQRLNLDLRIVTFSVSFRFGKDIKTRERRSGASDEQQRIRG